MRELIAVIALLLLPACTTSSNTGPRTDAGTLSHFQRGVTTYDQVVGALGQPSNVTTEPDGSRMAIYIAGQTRHEVNPLAAFSGGTTMSAAQSSVTFAFDGNNILQYYTTSQGGFGGAAGGVSYR